MRFMAMAVAIVVGLLLVAVPAQAQEETWTVKGPRQGPHAVVAQGAGGDLTLAVTRDGRPVLEPSPVGIVTAEVDLSTGLRYLGRSDRRVDERYTTTVGKQLRRRARMNETVLEFEGADGARLDLVVRASEDGVAYRYVLPEDRGSVLREASAFDVPDDATAWLGRHRRDYENPFVQYTAASAPTAEFMTPALFEVDGTYLLIAESDLDGSYSGSRLVHEQGSGSYAIGLWDEQVLVDGPLATPWRALIAGDLATVTESTFVDDLAPDSKLGDTSWVRPGQVLWTWIAGGRAAGQSLEKQKEYVDYASERGWPYVAVDAGWYFDPEQWDVTDPDWQTNSWMPELVRYAKARRSEILVWIHYRDLDTAEERERWLPTLQEWGVKGVKIDFMDAESQELLQWYDEILPATAEHELLVNFHGSNIPKGIHRTWPHVMTMEGVHGQEKGERVTADHVTALPYTRNVVGSMDYTPMAFHRDTRPTTDAHELGLAVVFESGLQNLAGTPESYEARPEAVRFLEQVPSIWDETRLLAGHPGDSTVLARRSRDRWFIGGSFAGAARTVDVPLDLDGDRWLVELVRDGEDGLARERWVIRDGQELSVDVPADGGFAAIACRYRARVETCDKPVKAVPETTVTVEPDGAQVGAGGSFEVTGRFALDESDRLSDVELAPRAPDGWTVEGDPAEARRLLPGDTLEGTWTVTAPEDAEPGAVDLPVVASFEHRGDRLEAEQGVDVHVLPPGWLRIVEAEDEANTLAGAARTGGCGACSGGEKVRFIGNGPENFLTFEDVRVEESGDYALIVDATVDGTRSFFVSANGGEGIEVPVTGTSWGEPTSAAIEVPLQAGANTLRFYNDGAHAADLDRIVVAEPASITLAADEESLPLDGTTAVRVTGDGDLEDVTVVSGDEGMASVTMDGAEGVLRAGTMGPGAVTLTATATLNGVPATDELEVEVRPEPARPFVHDYHQTLTMKMFMADREGDVSRTFEQGLEVIRKVDNLTRGIPKIFYLVGWQYDGHDTGYPAWDVVNPKLKRPQDETALQSLRWLIEDARKHNTTVSFHVNMLDASRESPLWQEYVDADVLARNDDGSLREYVWGHPISYTREWDEGLTQQRIDQLFEMFDMAEIGTIHVDALHQYIPGQGTGPISPYHDISTDQEIETQKKILRYFRDRGVDVTSEFAYSYRKDPLLGLQPMSWHFRDVDQMEIPPELHIGGRGGDPRFGESMQGESLIRSHPETLDGFLDEFATTTLLWHYLNRLERISDEDGVVTFSEEVTSEDGMVRQGETVLRDGDDLFVPAQWRSGHREIVAYSGEGYAGRSWRLPAGWENVRRVDLYRIGLEGLTRVDRKVRVKDGELTLSLPPRTALSVVPEGTDVGDAVTAAPHMFAARAPDDGATGVRPDRARFNWERSRKADEYRLLVDDDVSFESPAVDVTTARTKHVTGGLEPGTDYVWKVVAANDAGSIEIDGAPLGFRTAVVPAQPAGVAAYRTAGDAVLVTWDEAAGAATYTVERRSPGGEFAAVAEGVEGTSFRDGGEGPFEYRVTGVNDLGAGEPSAVAAEQDVSEARYLSDVEWESASSGWRTVQRDRSVGGNPLRLGGTTYEKGIGTHAESEIVYRLGERDRLFRAMVGIDEESRGSAGSIAFRVLLDGEPVYDSGVMTADPYTPPKEVLVEVSGHETLTLEVLDGGDGINSDHGDWADAQLLAAGIDFDKLPLAATPPMGWNSWNNFHCDIDEDLIKETADAMVSSGMKDAGYEYVNIDDCWMAPQRDADGYLQADPERFPSGIKAIADHVHAKGLKLGIYSSAGTKTCQGLPASLGYEEKDAEKFAEWEVDLLKYDNCNHQDVPAIERYTTMAEALAATGRPIVLSICEWGENDPWEWAGELGHLWRTTGDIRDTWGSMVSILDQQVGLEPFSGPHAWNDPDMLEVGNGGMTTEEYRSHMSLWALLNAPLLAGNDLRDMDAETLELLTNPEIIAIDQDWGGMQGRKIADEGDQEVWAKPMADGGVAVVLFNRGPAGAQVSTTAAELGLDDAAAYARRDVWAHDTAETRGAVRASIPSHGSRTFVVRPAEAGEHAPATFLDVRTDTNGFVDAGQTFTATLDYANDGTAPIEDVALSLAVEDGWAAEPQGATEFGSVAGGETVSAQFTVTAPADATTGTYDLSARAELAGDRTLDGYGTVSIATAPDGRPWLSDLDPLTVATGYGDMGVDESVDGNPIRIDGVTYEKGLSPHAASEVTYYLGGRCSRFTSDVGINDETRDRGSVTFEVLGDDREELAATGVIAGGEAAQSLDVNVSGVTVLTLVTGIGPDNNNHDHSEWAGARLDCDGPGTPRPLALRDPGFEDGGSAWTLAGGAQVASAAPKTGTRHALVPGGGSATQSVTAPATGGYDLSVWADAAAGGSELTVSVGGEQVASAPVRDAGPFYVRHTLPRLAVEQGDAVELAARAGAGELRLDDFSFARSAPADPSVRSSNQTVVELFEWAKVKANSWVHQPDMRGPINVDERQPAGTGEATYAPTYWAGYAHRTGYYGRDFAHQAAGASVLGLHEENKTMLRSFAASSTQEHKHYPVWAINFDAETYLSIDYRSPTSFVREVPAVFELVEKANAAYRWSGDPDYLDDPVLWDFYLRATDDFIAAHDGAKANGVAEGTGQGIFQGAASYNEQADAPLIEAGDAIGSQYQAYLAMAALARDKGDADLAGRFEGLATELKRYFNEEWSRSGDPGAVVRGYDTSGDPVTGWGKENSWFMPMKRIIEAGPRNDAYLDFVDAQASGADTAPRNIEAISYLPDTFFAHDRNETAWKWMRHVYESRDTRHVNARQGLNGDYPEIPFTLLSQTVQGLMGVQPDVPNSALVTLSRLPAEIEWLELEDVPFGDGTVGVRHDGATRSALTNRSAGELAWEARFPGRHAGATVDGAPAEARAIEVDGVPYTAVDVSVASGAGATVEVSG